MALRLENILSVSTMEVRTWVVSRLKRWYVNTTLSEVGRRRTEIVAAEDYLTRHALAGASGSQNSSISTPHHTFHGHVLQIAHGGTRANTEPQ